MDPLAEILAATQSELGPLKDETVTGIVGFQAGGSVNLIESQNGSYFITSELSTPEGYTPSREGFRYELALRAATTIEYAIEALTFLARHFTQTMIGDGDRIALGPIANMPALEGSTKLIYAKTDALGCFVVTPNYPSLFERG